MLIKISKKWLNHKFMCSEDYILNICEGTNKIIVSLLKEEEENIKSIGGHIEKGKLKPNITSGKCPYKKDNGLCELHYTNLKPLGCIISPFTINKNKTLIIRHRYSKMKCHGSGEPAYIVFKISLIKLFGEKQYNKLVKEINSEVDLYLEIEDDLYENLLYLDNLKKE